MNRCFLFLIYSIIGFTLFAHEGIYPEGPSYEIISSKKDSKISQTKAVFVFQFKGLDLENTPLLISYSIDNKEKTIYLNELKQLKITTNPGKHSFQFFKSTKYKEIFIPNIEIKVGYKTVVSMNFKLSLDENMNVKKPVIYLYPKVSTSVKINVKPKGEMTFSYPLYNDGWNVNAEPNGELTLNESKLNYLFWESVQKFKPEQFDFSTGFIVSKEESISFLEEKLTEFGLNSKEQSDFITFWGPELIKNNLNFIHFIFNDAADQFAELEISPKPDKILRVYLLYSSLDSKKLPIINPQSIPKMDRNGFTVIEWGGSELNITFESLN
jgi:hypothetical protein